jgi:molybdopterin-guanine dinucleotide biosynthesis protein A
MSEISIVIVAGGLGSRLAPLTNFIPKFLVNTGKNTGYVEQVRYWDKLYNFENAAESKPNSITSLTVIVHSKYAAMIEAYHKLYFPDFPVIVKTVDEANGSAHAILSSCDHLIGKSVLFQWCDVMPGCADPVFEHLCDAYAGQNVVFTNYEYPNRYGLTGNWHDRVPELTADSSGGVFGLYFIYQYLPKAVVYEDGQDFVEVISQFGQIREHNLEKIIDWGDAAKLDQTRDTADKAREFNKISFHGDLVLKESISDKGDVLMLNELSWYDEVVKTGSRVSIPRVWVDVDHRQSFVMSRVQGVPAYEFWLKADEAAQPLIFNKIIEQLRFIHDAQPMRVDEETFVEDIKAEAEHKLIARCAEIKDLIDSFGKVTIVNGFDLGGAEAAETIYALETMIQQQYTVPQYSLIHGDLQLSNSMIDRNWNVTIIDPRGYFGKTLKYGLSDYDYGKLLYSVFGYDLFNYSRTFHIEKLQNGELNFTIPRLPVGAACKEEMKKVFKPVHYMWMAVNWIGLAQYIKNDPVKSVCAYYHGLSLANQLVNAYITNGDQPNFLFDSLL